ncbi:gephyrin [Anoplophora glabripennis]|uniref:gephyrin n=1 Tax=Anoplophora glabripennis TaxID=217634 RepID=UPI000873761F|nr:gephyrin [Anoplophora glabripennis]XP_018571470.1 gephyrin [Anoplophora glabripennis]
MESVTFGILTVSDTCSRNEKDDTAAPLLQLEIKKNFPLCKFFRKIVPDEIDDIKETLESWIKYGCNVIFTVGGTGFSPRDVTPEATRAVIQKEAPGIAYAMVSKSLAITDKAMLSRAVCGINSKTLIINFPGSAKAAVECFGFIKDCIPHAVALLTNNMELVASHHKWIQENPKVTVATQSQSNQASTMAASEPPSGSKVKLNNTANRNRKSPYPMLEVEAALNIILAECKASLEKEELEFDKAANRVLAEDIYADEPVPPFRASIKDGYAVRAADGVGDRIVRNVTAAGDSPYEDSLKEGEVIRISTGAPIPLGADAVVQVEDTTLVEQSDDGSQEVVVRINVQPQVGQDIREIGSDIAAGELVLPKFQRISVAYIGVLAMLGKTKVKVFKRASIGIISTGNELKAPNEELRPGQIRDCNKVSLMNLLKRYSYESNDCGIAKDDPDSVKFAFEKAFATSDIVITTGGVSMGEYDIVKQVLEEDFHAIIHFARVNMKPGKPTTFATLSYKGQFRMVFALPGNPVSCCVTSLLFVVPLLRYIERSRIYQFPVVQVPISGLINKDERPEYHRVQVYSTYGGLSAVSTGKQISSRLNSLAGANGLAIVSKCQETKSNSSFSSKSNKYNVIIFDDILN